MPGVISVLAGRACVRRDGSELMVRPVGERVLTLDLFHYVRRHFGRYDREITTHVIYASRFPRPSAFFHSCPATHYCLGSLSSSYPHPGRGNYVVKEIESHELNDKRMGYAAIHELILLGKPAYRWLVRPICSAALMTKEFPASRQSRSWLEL